MRSTDEIYVRLGRAVAAMMELEKTLPYASDMLTPEQMAEITALQVKFEAENQRELDEYKAMRKDVAELAAEIRQWESLNGRSNG